MDFISDNKNFAQKSYGLGLVIVVHIFIAYILITGLARKVIDVVSKPVEVRLIAEVKPVTPPPPPPPKEIVKKITTPPPYVPTPAVAPDPIEPSVISQTSSQQPAKPEIPLAAPVVPATNSAPVVQSQPPPTVVVAAIADLNNCKPVYPRASLVAAETGVTQIEFVVGVDGNLVSAKVKKSSGSRKLDKAAIDGLSRCGFKPGTRNGKPVQSSFSVEYAWQIN